MSDAGALSRREFGSLCAILAASLTACSAVTTRTRTAAAFLTDPPLGDYDAVLRALIETVLPAGDPDFPMTVAAVERRLLAMFPLEHETRFLGLQRTLVYFNALDLAPHIAAPLISAEREALDVPERMSEREFRQVVASNIAFDDARTRGLANAGTFAALPPEGRAEWFEAWRGSAFIVKRQFAQSIRALINISAYSADDTWRAIGYAGPLVKA